MSTAQLKLRSDLVISRQEVGGTPSFVVKAPTTGQFFRLRDAEHYILQQLDGSTPLDVIRRKAEEQFGAPLPPETLKQFVKTLDKFGLLESDESDSGHLSGRSRRVRGSVFYLRFKLFDPDRLFNFLIGKVRFFFTPAFVFLAAVLILAAAGLTLGNWDEMRRALLRLYRIDTLPLAVLGVLIIGTCHEFAHGLTCKHYGGEVHEVGFLLIYFCPAFYCNVSDAWLFPEKSKRVWVTFAGPYFELFLWALSTLTWRLTDPGLGLNSLALVIMTISGVRTLFNFTPLIKLDGYYLLSDYLDIPNLRRRSFRYIGSAITRLWAPATEEQKAATPRERRIYLIYGLVAVTYAFWLLALIGDRYGRVLVAKYGGWGLALFGVVVVMKVRSRFIRLFSKKRDAATFDQTAHAPDKAKPAGKSKFARIERTARYLVTLAFLAFVALFGWMQLKVSGEFKVLPVQNADARVEIEGIVEKIHVSEGSPVQKGDLVAQLVDRDLRAQLRQTEASVAQKSAQLRLLQAGPRPEEIDVARATVAKSGEQLKYLTKLLNMNLALFARQLVSLKDLEAVEGQVFVQEKDVEGAHNALKVLLAGSRAEDIAATQAELTSLEGQQRYLEEQIALLKVVSPITGMVTTPWRQLRDMVGQHVNKGDLVAKVQELTTITAEIALSEKEIGDVKLGQTVALKVRAYPHETFYGKVTAIATTATGEGNATPAATSAAAPVDDVSATRAVLVTTQIENRTLLLKPEMTGKAKIYCGPRRILDLMTRRLARVVRVEFWAWW